MCVGGGGGVETTTSVAQLSEAENSKVIKMRDILFLLVSEQDLHKLIRSHPHSGCLFFVLL